jgi:hypothetical protein
MSENSIKTIGKVFIGVVLLAIVGIVLLVALSGSLTQKVEQQGAPQQLPQRQDKPAAAQEKTPPVGGEEADSTPGSPDRPVETAATYHESSEMMEAYQLSKNAYQWRGHSGILDAHMPLIRSDGKLEGWLPLPSLKFNKMISEHVAVFEVMNSGEESGDELAVVLPDSQPPDVTRPWNILVVGPLEGQSAGGAPITVTAVRFEGYYFKPVSPPPPEGTQ